MGYTTEFTGSFSLNKKLEHRLHDYLMKFNESRRMKRNLPPQFGIEGEFFVEGVGFKGQGDDESVLDHNKPPRTQPGLWCQWIPSDDGMHIEWDGNEKFYEYSEWIVYIIQNFLAPNGYILNGEVKFQGEDDDDFGQLVIQDNILSIKPGVKSLGPSELYHPSKAKNQVRFVMDQLFETEVLEIRDVSPKQIGSRNAKEE